MLTALGPKIGNRLSANIKSLRSITKFKEYIRVWSMGMEFRHFPNIS